MYASLTNESTSMNQTATSEITYLEDGVIASFYVVPKLKQFVFDQTGVKEFDNQEMVSIRIPGDKMVEVTEEVMEHHKNRFKNTYRAFKEGNAAVNGTPLDNFPDLDPATVAKLKYLGIQSVESLAAVSDSTLPQLGINARELRDRASRYVNSASENKTTEKLLEQNQEIQELKAKLEQFMNMKANAVEQGSLEKVQVEAKRPAGRPKTVLPPHMLQGAAE